MKIILNKTLILFFLIGAFVTSTAQTYKQPILISSAGQSADVKLVETLIKKENWNYTTNSLAEPNNLSGMKTLIIVPGFSSKGLGAAGISKDKEMERVKNLIAKAKQSNIPIILVHVGGMARREGQSDDFNKLVGESCKYMIVVESGDGPDKFFTNLAAKQNVTLKLVSKIKDVADPLKALFN